VKIDWWIVFLYGGGIAKPQPNPPGRNSTP
jgi:hypothetical protein